MRADDGVVNAAGLCAPRADKPDTVRERRRASGVATGVRATPLKPRSRKTAALHCAASSVAAMKSLYGPVLFASDVGRRCEGASDMDPVSLQGRRRRSEASSAARDERTSE